MIGDLKPAAIACACAAVIMAAAAHGGFGSAQGESAGTGTGDILADGTVPLTGDWDVGPYELRAATFESDVATGTAPFTVASTTPVANLAINAAGLPGLAASVAACTSTQAAGSVMIANSGSVVPLAPGTSTYVLTSNGTGEAPSWQAAAGGSVEGLAADLAAVTSTQATGSLIVVNSDGATTLAPGAAGLPLVSAGTGLPPTWGGQLLVYEAHTAEDTLTDAESWSIHSNAGASGALQLGHPASRPVGWTVTLKVEAAQELRFLVGSADILMSGGLISSVNYLSSSQVGAYLVLTWNGTKYISTSEGGLWQYNTGE